MAAIKIDVIKAAIRAWVLAGSGLADDRVIWTLGARTPPSPYIHMRLRFATIGNDFVDTVANPTPTAGHDALYIVRGNRLGTLSMQCFAAEASANERAPEQILNDVLTAISLPTIGDTLAAAGVGVTDLGEVTPVDLTIDSSYFEPRAVVDVKFNVVASLSETGPSIGSVAVGPDTTPGADAFVV